MPYRLSYIDRSVLTDGPLTEGTPGTEEFPTEPAELARASELLEDIHCEAILVWDNSGERLGGVRLQRPSRQNNRPSRSA
jgi:hypothetical protein